MNYKFRVDINNYNQFNNLKLTAYPSLLSEVADNHLKNTDQGVGVVIKEKYAWVLVSMKIVLEHSLKDEELEGATWYSGNRGPFYRREYQISNNGEVFLKAASYSVLLDLETRSVFREKKLPFAKLPEIDNHLVILNSSFKENVFYEEIYRARVSNSMIDVFNHVNNLKYSEICYDALTEAELKKLTNLSEIELYFHKEMYLNDEFIVSKAIKDNYLYLKVYNKTNDIKAFTMKLVFKEEGKLCEQ